MMGKWRNTFPIGGALTRALRVPPSLCICAQMRKYTPIEKMGEIGFQEKANIYREDSSSTS